MEPDDDDDQSENEDYSDIEESDTDSNFSGFDVNTDKEIPEEVVEHLNDGSLSNRASLEVLHAVLASEGDCLHLCHRVVACGSTCLVLLLSVGPLSQIHNHESASSAQRDCEATSNNHSVFALLYNT